MDYYNIKTDAFKLLNDFKGVENNLIKTAFGILQQLKTRQYFPMVLLKFTFFQPIPCTYKWLGHNHSHQDTSQYI